MDKALMKYWPVIRNITNGTGRNCLERKTIRQKGLAAARELGITEPFTWKNKIAAWFPSLCQYCDGKTIPAESIAAWRSNKGICTAPEQRSLLYTTGSFYTQWCSSFQHVTHMACRNCFPLPTVMQWRMVQKYDYPFSLHELAEFIFSLPSHFKIRKGWTKWLLWETMKENCPPVLRGEKDKVGFLNHLSSNGCRNPGCRKLYRKPKETGGGKILKQEVLQKPVNPMAAHAADNYDWRYLSSSYFGEMISASLQINQWVWNQLQNISMPVHTGPEYRRYHDASVSNFHLCTGSTWRQ